MSKQSELPPDLYEAKRWVQVAASAACNVYRVVEQLDQKNDLGQATVGIDGAQFIGELANNLLNSHRKALAAFKAVEDEIRVASQGNCAHSEAVVFAFGLTGYFLGRPAVDGPDVSPDWICDHWPSIRMGILGHNKVPDLWELCERIENEAVRAATDKRRRRDDDSCWMRIADAERITGINRGIIKRAADDGDIADNGKTGDERRLDRQSFSIWAEKKAKQAKQR